MTSPSEQDHVLQSLQDFCQLLLSRIPLLKHRHFSEFCLDEAQILETCRLVKVEVIQQFVAKISHLSEEISTKLFKDLSIRIQVMINDLLVKNQQHKNDCEAFLKRRMENITEDIKSTMEVKLKLNTDAMEDEVLEDVIWRGMGVFDNYRHGNIEFFEGKRETLKQALEQFKNEIMEKLSIPTSSSNKTVQVQDQVQPSVQFPVLGDQVTTPSSSSSSQIKAMTPPLEETSQSQSPEDNQTTGSGICGSQDPSSSGNPIPQSFTGGYRRKVGDGTSGLGLSSKRPKLNEAVVPGTSANSGGDVVPGSSVATSKSGRVEAGVLVTMTYPLIFRLSTNSISMGTNVGDSFLRIPCQQNGELSLRPVLALNESGILVFGAEALDFQNPGDDDYWSLQEFLAYSNCCPPELISFRMRIGMRRRTQAMTLEFFLGLLLQNLKTSAESHQKKTFMEAVIAVPIWLTSYHRIQIKDAAWIAGFSVVNLVNQEAVAACALLSVQIPKKPRGEILVLVENFGILSAILYRYRPTTEDLEMIGDHHIVLDEDNQVDRIQMVRGLRVSLFRRADAKMKYFFLTDSAEWLEAFSQEYGMSEGQRAEKLFGCGTLCGNIVQEIYDKVAEYLPKGLGLHLGGFFSQPKISLVDVVKVELPLEDLFQPEDDHHPRMFQENIASEYEPVLLGQLEFKGRTQYAEEFLENAIVNCRLDLEFQIDAEGVVTLHGESIRVTKLKKNSKEMLQTEDFVWTCFNLDEGKREDIKRVVNRICLENRIRSKK